MKISVARLRTVAFPVVYALLVPLMAVGGLPAGQEIVRAEARADITTASRPPIGRVDSVQIVPGGVIVRGWALDPVANESARVLLSGEVFGPSDPVWDNTTIADQPRPDIAAAFPGYGALHGFTVVSSRPISGAREFSVFASAGSVQTGDWRSAPIFGYGAPGSGSWPARSQIPVPVPFGSLDRAVPSGPHRVTVSGWAMDLDATSTELVHLYVDGRFAAQVQTTGYRADVAAAFPFGTGPRGFSADIDVSGSGMHTVCAYGINQGAGATNPLLGCRTVSGVSGSPIGSLDAVAGSPGSLSVRGWTLDPDTTDPIVARVYVDGAFVLDATADLARGDVGAAFPGYGPAHAFSVSLAASRGPHTVCVYGLDVGPGDNSTVGCRTVRAPGGPPFGNLDSVVGAGGSVSLAGWSIDPDTADPTRVQVYVDGRMLAETSGDGERPDVAAAYPGYGQNHGFSIFAALPVGTHTLCVSAVDVTGGDANALLGCRSTRVPAGS